MPLKLKKKRTLYDLHGGEGKDDDLLYLENEPRSSSEPQLVEDDDEPRRDPEEEEDDGDDDDPHPSDEDENSTQDEDDEEEEEEEEDDIEEDVEEEEEDNDDDDFVDKNTRSIVNATKSFATQMSHMLMDDDELDNMSEEEEDELLRDIIKPKEALLLKSKEQSEWYTIPERSVQEIQMMSRVVRDEEGKIVDPLHRTACFFTKYEITAIIGMRIKQLISGATPMVDVPNNLTGLNHILEHIALLELREKKIPFIIERPVGRNHCEYWRVQDLELLDALNL